jgi:hypothetical protein
LQSLKTQAVNASCSVAWSISSVHFTNSQHAFAPNLRPDPAFKLACGRLPDSGRDLCIARAVYSRLLTPLVGLLGGVVLDFSDRVSGDNSFIESFNSKFGAEWLNTHTGS